MANKRILDKANWQVYFDRVSKSLGTLKADIRLTTGYHDVVAAEHQQLRGITYDPRNDLLEVSCDNLDHLIRTPRSIVVTEDEGHLEGIEVEQQDGSSQQVSLVRPLFIN